MRTSWHLEAMTTSFSFGLLIARNLWLSFLSIRQLSRLLGGIRFSEGYWPQEEVQLINASGSGTL